MKNRRDLLHAMAIGSIASLAPTAAATGGTDTPQPNAQPAETPQTTGHPVGMLLYPGFTALDFVGPHYFLASLGVRAHLITNQDTLDPVASDLGLAIQPTMRLSEAPQDFEVLFVPGGSAGTLAAMAHTPTLEFLRSRAPRTRWKTSVCTGSFILGAAGLLRGKRATSHWLARDALTAFGATPVDERIVRDSDTITGAGVSAGLDMALAVAEAVRGRAYAQALMLQAEYAPAPPFVGGRPDNTDPATVERLRTRSQFQRRAQEIAAAQAPD